MRIRARTIFGWIAVLGALGTDAIYYYGLKPQGAAHTTLAAPAPVPIEAATVERDDVPRYLYSLGQAQAWNTITVRSRVDGEIVKIGYKEGQDVKKGDLLIQIDPRPFQAALDQATAKKSLDEALLANQKRDLERYEKVGTLAQSQQQIDTQHSLVAQTSAQIRQDQASVEAAQVQLAYTTITAPISGRMGLRLVDLGNIVHATDTTGVASITEVEPIAVIFTEPQEQLPVVVSALKSGPLPVVAYTSDRKKELGQGELAIVDNQVDQASGSIKLKARFPNNERHLWPGLTVATRLTVEILKGVVTIPDAAVIRGPNRLYAYVLKPDDTVEQRDLKIASMQDGVDVVESGVVPGDRVVVSGYYRLQPGSKVQVNAKSVPEQTARGNNATKSKPSEVE